MGVTFSKKPLGNFVVHLSKGQHDSFQKTNKVCLLQQNCDSPKKKKKNLKNHLVSSLPTDKQVGVNS
jgi:hypothetical protein